MAKPRTAISKTRQQSGSSQRTRDRFQAALRTLTRGRAMRALQHKFGRTSVAGLDQSHRDALVAAAGGPLTMAALAEAIHVDPSNATKTVSQLIEAGLLVRARDPADQRRMIVQATTQGRRVAQRLLAQRREFIETVFAAFNPTEQAQLADLMEKLVDSIERLNEA